MKISDIEKKIDATYNTIKRFIESDSEYHKKVDNVLHATDLGMDKLEEKYGIKGEILADNKIKKADKAVNSPYLITDDVVNKAKKHFLNENLKSEEKEEKIDSILI